jgi:TusA-related sulfurtransferase
MPIIEAAKAMANLSEGAVLVLWATDPAIESDLPAWCEACGHTLLSLERREARFIGRVSKGSR